MDVWLAAKPEGRHDKELTIWLAEELEAEMWKRVWNNADLHPNGLLLDQLREMFDFGSRQFLASQQISFAQIVLPTSPWSRKRSISKADIRLTMVGRRLR